MAAEVLFIGGHGRSGSTLLGRLGATVPGTFFAGELAQVWTRGFIENQLCGCGAPFRDCPVWSAVAERVTEQPAGMHVDEVAALEHRLNRVRNARAVARGRDPDVERFREVLGILHGAVAEVTGSVRVVDSSKRATYALILAGAPGVSLRFVHLVRDPRAVAWSRSRVRVRPEVVGVRAYMGRASAAKTALAWVAANQVIHRARHNLPGYRVVRYEGLVAAPSQTVADVFGGEASPDVWGSDEAGNPTAELDVAHTVSGNPARFVKGPVPIREDAEWRARLGTLDRFTVTALAGLGMARYGYLGGGLP